MVEKEIIATEKAPAAFGPWSQGVKAGGFIFTQGHMGMNPETGNILGTSIEDETKQALENLKATLEAADASLSDVVKTTVFLTDLNEYAKMNGIYSQYFTEGFPARSTVQVSALAKGAKVEIEAIALCK